jgi:hypothetical protein
VRAIRELDGRERELALHLLAERPEL